jgi:sorting nexin-1/2
MDGFDDLLSSSRGDLEDNPFADPFLKRSSSPDPWANPYAQQQATPVESSSVEDDTTTDALPASDANERTESTPTLEAKPDSGPLDLTALDEPDEQPPPPSSTSTSGFREFTVAESPKIPELVEGHSSLDAPTQPSTSSAEPTQPAHASESASVLSESASASESVVPPSTQAPAASWEPPSFVSPLDKPQSPIAQSFANLPLGSEGAGGWQAPGDWQSSQLSNDGQPSSSAASWHSRQPTDEEDEDDKPLQAIVDRSRADAELNGKHTNGVRPSVMRSTTSADAACKTSSSAIPLTMDDSARPMFSITVEDPQKVGDPIRGYTMYTVQTSVRHLHPKLCVCLLIRSRPHRRPSAPLSFPSYAATPTSCGFMRHCRSTTLA